MALLQAGSQWRFPQSLLGGELVLANGGQCPLGDQPSEPWKYLMIFPLSVQVVGVLWAQPQDLRAGARAKLSSR